MKREFDICPKTIDESKLYGFSWMEHVMAIPSPLVVVTSYKDNGMPNATMQSWVTFTGEEGYYCIFSSVNKHGHMYSSIKSTKQCVINFPSKNEFLKCMRTIDNNGYDNDEIALSGLTVETASKVNAPKIKECFLNLECEYMWEKELKPEGNHVVMCVKIINICMDEEYYNEQKKGRYGNTGYLYNIHSPKNPETGKTEETCVGIIQKYATYDKL
nr:flavin reductase family protein [uncultured Sellimonas sp.]